ncbi:MAG: hypothetical protein U0800_03285 [Isosphaeraceae bacterium]
MNATAFSVTDARLDARTIPESCYIFLRKTDRRGLHRDGLETSRLLSPRNLVLILDNDGVQVCGMSVLDAFDRLEVLNRTNRAINAKPLGPTPMSDGAIEELTRAFLS